MQQMLTCIDWNDGAGYRWRFQKEKDAGGNIVRGGTFYEHTTRLFVNLDRRQDWSRRYCIYPKEFAFVS